MKHFLGLFFLILLASGCSKTQENKETTPTPVKDWNSHNPKNSEYYQSVLIHPIFGMEKDTFQLGDTLKLKAWFNENISMLKDIAQKEGWKYSIQFEKGIGYRKYFNPDAGDTGMISFIVEDTTLAPGEVKKKTFSFTSYFGYWEEEKEGLLFDTTFSVSNIPYYIAN